MLEFLSLKEDAFGLDLNDFSVKLVKLKKRKRGFGLASFNSEEIPAGIVEGGVIKNEDALAKIIRTAYATAKGKKISTKYVIASLPEEKSFLQVIQMPKMTAKELETAVPLEAENYIPMPISDVYLDFEVISPVKDYLNNLEVLIMAMPKKIVDSYVLCIKKAGLVPVILEAESQALARAIIKKDAEPSMTILIDLGEDSTNFVVYSGNSVRFTSSIPICSQDELASQIKKYMSFYRDHSSYEYLLPGNKTTKVFLCGGGSGLKGLGDFLSKKLDNTVEIADPFTNLQYKKSKISAGDNPISFATAIGLALRKTDD